METTDAISSGVTVIGAETPSNYHVAPRTVNPTKVTAAAEPAVAVGPAVAVVPVSMGMSGMTGKKKRGRPRKYGPDGALSRALSPMPISSLAPPPIGDFSAGKQSGDFSAGKQSRGRPKGSMNKNSVELSGRIQEKKRGGLLSNWCNTEDYSSWIKFITSCHFVVKYIDMSKPAVDSAATVEEDVVLAVATVIVVVVDLVTAAAAVMAEAINEGVVVVVVLKEVVSVTPAKVVLQIVARGISFGSLFVWILVPGFMVLCASKCYSSVVLHFNSIFVVVFWFGISFV